MSTLNQPVVKDIPLSIYGTSGPLLEETMQMVLEEITKIRNEMAGELGMDPVEHLLGRIKSEESMREKCRRKGLPETPESALEKIHDAIGLRVVCAFLDDIYTIRDRLLALPRIRLVEEKDYIRHVKPNGYRSFHMIIIVDEKIYAEIQLRTISMDTWAALEHHLKYKKEIGGNTALISAELKRCADELASTDSSMQTLRDMIRELH
ncbi:MAG: GTP pyrophosphokinase family protein [Lachnospiraceae bacterium]|jgi:ppGpp synthetase/RelA/SpoT-type nucleotidyltranferase|nr:GTP pyrophosphokinase family protein [Lachnospiraceae bacterium]MBR3187121.1 GTP pyrophosphokinase family protein [Lachnospiraceae bacterium]MDO4409209.1 GTP pyrophosphokinase family protein [Eubacteriales bacterium]